MPVPFVANTSSFSRFRVRLSRMTTWKPAVVAPGSDMTTVTTKLGQSRLFKRGRANDATLDWPNLPRDEGEILGDLLLP